VIGNSIDTICGYVRAEESGDCPFLYLVQEGGLASAFPHSHHPSYLQLKLAACCYCLP
jgi:hypothetical protein